MRQRLIVAFLTVLVFSAGYFTRAWTERVQPLPPPPVAIGEEFKRAAARPADARPPSKPAHDRTDRARLIAEIDKVRPQIETYRKRLEEIDTEYDHDLMALLTPEQRDAYVARQKRMAERRAKGAAREAAETGPLSDEQILRLQQFPLFNVLWNVAITARLDRLGRDLKLAPEQLPKIREALLVRREKFLALVDSTPPPSIQFSELAGRTQKISEPAK